jgi:SAM-dependent methyltransferase
MTNQSRWTRDRTLEYFQQRTLERCCPPLIPHLNPGINVLDVGCGPGGLSLEIASRLRPGELTGVDREAKSIEHAKALASERGVENATFKVSDATSLQFADATFDMTVSLHVLNYLRNPSAVIAEWRRVTRSGGKVIAQAADIDAYVYYPPCPARRKWNAAYQVHTWGEDCADLGRRGEEIFASAGLRDIRVEVYGPPEFLFYSGVWPGVPHGTDRFRQLVAGPLDDGVQVVIDAGLVDEETVKAANREGEAWLAHPHAFYTQICFLISGTVP